MSSRYIEVNIDDIILLDKNPRYIEDVDFEKLKEDIKKDPTLLPQKPPLLNLVKKKYYCYAGTQRVKAAKELGYTKIFCFVEDNVPEKVQDERMIKDNLHRGKWDYKILLEEFDFSVDELKDFGIPNDIDLEIDIPMAMEPEFDEGTVEKNYETYLNNNIKQVVLYYEGDQYADVLERLHKVSEKYDLNDNSSVVLKLLELNGF